MDIIIKIFEALINIPVPTILMIAGLAFIFIGIVGNFKGKFAISHNKQIICVVIGFCILLLGIALWWISDKPAPDAKTNEWSIATAEAAWSPRYKHTSIVFNDKMWVIGGKEGNHPVNDVWFSTDGVEWKQATSRAAWSPRSHHTSLVFDDKMWVIGGRNSAQALNDVWFSTDGAKWKQATDNAEWPPRSHHASVVFNDMVWVLGGIGSGERKNDVWFSSDGVNWQIAVANAPWAARSFHPCIVLRTDFFGYANHLWLLGGSEKNRDLNDIWHTTDGRKWIEVLADIAWPPRGGHTSLSFNRRMWILGGGDAVVPKNDVWFCNDGTNWKQLHIETKWSPRFGHSSVIFKDKMWVIGGGTNDVWFFRLNK